MSATIEQQLADLHRANQVLEKEREAALAGLRRCLEQTAAADVETLKAENEELRAAQAAGLDVLQTIAASPGQTEPVFDLIARQVAKLCEVPIAVVGLFDGAMVHLVTQSGFDDAYSAVFASQFPRPPSPDFAMGRAILTGRIEEMQDTDTPDRNGFKRPPGPGSALAVPLMRNGATLGAIAVGRRVTGPFPRNQVTLLRTFAEQAVIAMENARLLDELHQRSTDLQESLDYQTAISDVLRVISGSTFDLEPVFGTVAATAVRLCRAHQAAIYLYQDGEYRWAGGYSQLPDYEKIEREVRIHPGSGTLVGRVALHGRPVQILDAWTDPLYEAKEDARVGAIHTLLGIPLLRDGLTVGVIGVARQKIEPFTDRQIELVSTFAAQAVIAMENARLIDELRARTEELAKRNSEYGERIEHQSATIDVLKAMSNSPDDTQPVFDLITRRAQELCNSKAAGVFEYDGELVHLASIYGVTDIAGAEDYARAFPMRPKRGSIVCRAILDKETVHIRDLQAEQDLLPAVRALGVRSNLAIPLLRDGVAVGAFVVNSLEPGGFTDSQVSLVQTFAEQAVIAMTSVANFRALRERTSELTRSVSELQALEEVLRAVNSSLDLDTVLATIISRAVQLSDADEGSVYEFDEAQGVFVPKSAYGMSADWLSQLRDRRIRIGETALGRSAAARAPLHIADLSEEPEAETRRELMARGVRAMLAVPLLREDKVIGGLVIRRYTAGGFGASTATLLQTFAGQCVLAIENARLFRDAERERAAAETALADLRRAQDRLVQSEKMASLGQLTAGIAHEIKNPLNFVNNFAELSVDLLDELHDAMAGNLVAETDEIATLLKNNLARIAEHGRRADSIVKNMLLHSRSGPSEYRLVDLNAVVEEAVNLAYHGARAETPGFNITVERHLDPAAGMVEMFPQDFTRVMLNLIANGFYAARQRADRNGTGSFEPMLTLITRDLGDRVAICVHDNGTGIPSDVRDKIFEPFFTTKPAGEGTGLGLSLSYDIIVKQHGGQLTVDSRQNEFTEFCIVLPRRLAANERAPA
jgi:GAF domain-containing protein/anti-sigma regulatory factor (Ser/Thr protein kinase)